MAWKISKCGKCNKMIATLIDSPCPTLCCGEEMEVLKAGTTDAAVEKHVPAVTVEGKKVSVQVGSTLHPMMEKHYIQFIAINTKQGGQIKYLAPGEEPVAEFVLSDDDEFISAIEFCNLHGLWEA